MKALVWHGQRDVRVDEVPDPTIRKASDAAFQEKQDGAVTYLVPPGPTVSAP